MCDIIFDKAEPRDGTVNRISDYKEAVVRLASIENVF